MEREEFHLSYGVSKIQLASNPHFPFGYGKPLSFYTFISRNRYLFYQYLIVVMLLYYIHGKTAMVKSGQSVNLTTLFLEGLDLSGCAHLCQ